mmetsp:Transcript_9413/g.13799  ORF Transcript_9413/g.13799 Transcript_9413/m.13799 type:complete len:100 (-) Transcript_9413:318-617(-)
MSFKRLVPLLDRVLVSRVLPETKSAGGLLLPESAQTKMNRGVVIAVGNGARDAQGAIIPMGIKAGDNVLLPEWGGNDVKIDGEDFTLFRHDDILGILEN